MNLATTPITAPIDIVKLFVTQKMCLSTYNRLMCLLLLIMLLNGCSAIKIVPEQVTGGLVNPVKNSQTITKINAEVLVRVDDSAINSYNLDSTITSFYISIKNSSSNEITVSEDSFVLIDETGLQYSLLTPEKVRDMLKKDSYYLMPYPYVGFYYLEDYQKTNFYNRSNSSLPYYYELYPQDIFSKALPMSSIIPGMRIEGLTYFKFDPAAHSNLKLLVFLNGTPKSSTPDFSFPFKIIK